MKQQLNNSERSIIEQWLRSNKNKHFYWVNSAYFGHPEVNHGDRKKFDNQTILLAAPSSINGKEQVLVCSFHLKGHGFYYEQWDHFESMQVYKATENRDYYFSLIELFNKTTKTYYTIKGIYTKQELIRFLIRYFDQLQSSFTNGKDDSMLNSFYEFINK